MTRPWLGYASSVLVFGLLTGCSTDQVSQQSTSPATLPQPADEFVVEEGEDNDEARKRWIEELHRCSPDTDWRWINQQNASQLAARRVVNAQQRGAGGSESFANGQLMGTWSDRGSNNQSGSMDKICYVPQTDQIYGFGGELSGHIGGRSLWRGNRDGSGWTLLWDNYNFRSDILEAFVPTGSSTVRLVTAERKYLYYSDDEGQSWQSPTFDPDMEFVGFGRRHQLNHLEGVNGTLFYLVETWDPDPWAYRIWIYRSTDNGLNYDRVHVFDETSRSRVDSWIPKTGATAYVLEADDKLHSFTPTGHTSVNCSGLPSGANEYQLTGSLAGGLTLFALIDGDEIYRSNNGGANWTYVATAPINAWAVGMECSPNDPDTLFIGGVNCFSSYDGGVNWILANEWWEYYGNTDLLHADMMEFEFGETTSGTDFLLIGNHGGIHATYDDLVTTTNISKNGLNVCMYYDVLTHPTQTQQVYLGAQDQGWQWTDNADIPGPWDVVQVISGDYGQMHLTRNQQSYWNQYPYGWFFYYHDSSSPLSSDSNFNLDGQHMPSWIVPTGGFRADPALNSILVGGGDVNNGSGSHLVKLTASTSPPHSISTSQYSYDFRANSDSGNGRISAIEQPAHDIDTIYVTTSDGSFFRTINGGASWQKTAGFQVAPTEWIYTSTIHASRLDPNLVWTSGSGYNNPPVYKSTDGGDTFVPMSNGLPDTLVQEVVANPAETMLFAATDAGPFVYIVADDMWYSLLGAETPLNWFTSVEYVEALDTVRFATMGRGVWDFEIDFGTWPTESIEVVQGVVSGGTIGNLEVSDNIDLSVQRDPASIQSRVTLEAGFTSPTLFPRNLTLVLESSVFARSTIQQQVEMFNYQTSSYEQVDLRNASRFSDQVVEISLPGDLTRFVEPGTGYMEARIRYSSASQRQNFSANVDQLIWQFE